MIAALRHGPRSPLQGVAECLRLLTTLRLDPARVRLISGFIDTYLRLNAGEELRFKAQVAKVPDEQQKHHVMEIVTSWMEAGLERGLEQGLQQGLQQGLRQRSREDIIEVLEARFGEVPYTLREHILAVGDEAELKRLHRQSALVNTLADFCALIAQPPAQ